jgi:predicted DNA-binding transcriptional regulator YafY
MALKCHFLTSIRGNLNNMANTSSRTLRLLSLLQTHRYWPGAELAERLGVSVRTLRRDIDRLRELGYPVDASRGVDGGYQLAAGAALPPLVLDDEEAVALAVGLQAAAQGGVAGIAESSVRALAKVVQVMPPRLRRRVDTLRAMTVPAAWSGPTIDADPDVLITLAQACRDTERLEFGYRAASGAQSSRLVEPLRLVALGRRWYLVAYDLTRHDWRSFRIDRIEEARRTGARFRPRDLPAEDAAAFVRAGVDRAPAGWSVEVLIDAPVAQVQAHVSRWGTTEAAPDGRCLLRMQVDSLDWPAMVLGGIGAEFEVVTPPELLEQVQAWARTFQRAALRGSAPSRTGPLTTEPGRPAP